MTTETSPKTISVLSQYTGITTYNVVYGYERPCGRAVLVLIDIDTRGPDGGPVDPFDWFGLNLAEVISPTVIHVDAGPAPRLHEKMLTAVPGENVKYKGLRMRKLTEKNLAPLIGVAYTAASMPPPNVMRSFGDVVPGDVHECDRCYWK